MSAPSRSRAGAGGRDARVGPTRPSLVGVLALQGAFAAHAAALDRLGVPSREIRAAADLTDVTGLVLPGGESTAQLNLLDRDPALLAGLDALARSGAPVLATCAGLILAAAEVLPAQPSFGWLDVTVRRNGWGRQVASAEATADDGTPLVLIRAPRIERVGPGVAVEATLRGEPVLVRAANVWGATHHPELGSPASEGLGPFSGDALHARLFAPPGAPAPGRADRRAASR